MTRLRTTLGPALAALAVLATGTARAGDRPIQASGTGFLDMDDFVFPELFGPGEGDHLGRCGLFVSLDPEALDQSADLAPLGVRLFAASGDNLFAAVDGAEFDPGSGLLAVSITFTGGSGRFSDATGGATLLILFDGWAGPATGARFSWSLDGTIDY